MKLLWTQEAIDQLVEIDLFISIDDPSAAENFIQKIRTESEKIVTMPYMGRVVPEFGEDSIREIIFRGYRIVYRIVDDKVYILTVFEGHKMTSGIDTNV